MDRKTKITWASVVIGFLVVFALLSPWVYFAESIEGWVVDAKTGKPLEGVIVVAHWELNIGTPAGRIQGGQLEVMETITDKKGRYYFPGWGPKIAMISYLDEKDPNLIYFKPGYKYDASWNLDSARRNRSMIRRSMWDGKTIKLKKFKGSLKEYAGHLSFMHTSVRSILAGGKCEWKKIPKLVIAIDKQEEIFRKNNIYSPLYSIEGLPSSGCGSPSEYFKGLAE